MLSIGNEATQGSLGQSPQEGSSSLCGAQKHFGYKQRLPSFVQIAVQEAAPSVLTLSQCSRNLCWITLEMGPVPWHWEGVCQGPASGTHSLFQPPNPAPFPTGGGLGMAGDEWCFSSNFCSESPHRYPCNQFMAGCASPLPQLKGKSASLCSFELERICEFSNYLNPNYLFNLFFAFLTYFLYFCLLEFENRWFGEYVAFCSFLLFLLVFSYKEVTRWVHTHECKSAHGD